MISHDSNIQCVFPWQGGVVRLHCSASNPLVYSGCLDGVVRVWDVRSGECVQQWYGHSDHILDITVARLVLSSAPPFPSLTTPLPSLH